MPYKRFSPPRDTFLVTEFRQFLPLQGLFQQQLPIAPVAAGITGPPTPTHLGTTTNIYVKNVDADAVRAMRALEKSVRLIVRCRPNTRAGKD
jgi:hypothetical protein